MTVMFWMRSQVVHQNSIGESISHFFHCSCYFCFRLFLFFFCLSAFDWTLFFRTRSNRPAVVSSVPCGAIYIAVVMTTVDDVNCAISVCLCYLICVTWAWGLWSTTAIARWNLIYHVFEFGLFAFGWWVTTFGFCVFALNGDEVDWRKFLVEVAGISWAFGVSGVCCGDFSLL